MYGEQTTIAFTPAQVQTRSMEQMLSGDTNEQREWAKLIARYKKLASTATFTNELIRKVERANYTEHPCAQGLGNGLCGRCIKLSTIKKHCCFGQAEKFLCALHNREEYESAPFYFMGYIGTLRVYPRENGDVAAFFEKEYMHCDNGYLYELINNDTFVFLDKY